MAALNQAFVGEHPFEVFELYIEAALEAVSPRRLLLMLDEFDKLQEGIDAGITSPQVPENIRLDGGVPLLVCALLRKLWEQYQETRTPQLSKPEIDRAAGAVLDERHELLAELWDDCDGELRADLGALAAADIPVADLSEGRRRALESRGLGCISKNHLRSSCRLMQRHAEERAPVLADLARLLGPTAGFETHIRSSLLELRLAQVRG